ncbi:MAG: permease prefix domain 1-containing protein [Acidobacteria bacterium]|nr:permease prefix domain 1-containing protein [Acidobacteriota bacterium]
MRWVQLLWLRLRALLRPADADRELHDEIEKHLAYLTMEHIAAGMSPDEAHDAALRDLEGVTRTGWTRRWR